VVRRSARAKINLGLEVLGRRADGYHALATVFQEIDLADDLEFRIDPELRLEREGDPAPPGEENLVLRAARALAAATGVSPRARIRLHKRIPTRAGLGGGSSDAAATLLGLDRLWGTALGPGRLRGIAAALGSDVPFFLTGGTALGHRRGECIHRLPPLPALGVVVVAPHAGLSTPAVFRAGEFALTPPRNCNIIRRFAHYERTGDGLAELVRNDLQVPAERLLPEIQDWRRRLQDLGATCAALSGSGSAVFGLFPAVDAAVRAAGSLHGEARVFATGLVRRRPGAGSLRS
jgi:4-diphosphocytidyl-2-C-methyl-D-erythritol kinase